MIGYMSFEEQVEADFVRARGKAWLRRLLSSLTESPASERLACFAELGERLGAAGGVRVGRLVVRSEEIVGSARRCSEFDANFLSIGGRTRERWERVDRAFRRGDELPPVSLYGIDGSYFVLDGNHRVSVARYHGVAWMDAEVTEFRSRSTGFASSSTKALPTSTALKLSVT